MRTRILFLLPLTLCSLGLTLIAVPALLMGRRDPRQERNTELIAAIRRHDALSVESWLQRGADANCPVPQTYWTQHPSTPLVEALLGNEGDTPRDYPAITRSLLLHGAEVSRVGWGWTPVQAAASRGKAVSLQLLLQRGANANAGKGSEFPALFYADVTPAMAQQMLACGADVNMTDNAGKTALYWAYIRNYPDSLAMAQALLEQGADVTRKDRTGVSPLSLAAQAQTLDDSRRPWYALFLRYAKKTSTKFP